RRAALPKNRPVRRRRAELGPKGAVDAAVGEMRLTGMAYDASHALRFASPDRARTERTDDEFRRGERLVVVVGASLAGALAGMGAALFFGRTPSWMSALAGLPVYALALYLVVATLRDASERRAY